VLVYAELLRKVFIFWNQSTHHSVRRRERLRRKEERTRQALLSKYWGRWRDAYKELQLRDAVCFVIQYRICHPR